MFLGSLKVTEIKQFCKWKACNYLNDVHKHDCTFSCEKNVRFRKMWVFLKTNSKEKKPQINRLNQKGLKSMENIWKKKKKKRNITWINPKVDTTSMSEYVKVRINLKKIDEIVYYKR